MDPWSCAAVSALILANGLYVRLIVQKKAHPALATWIMFFIATLLNALTYLTASAGDAKSLPTGLVDVPACLIVAITIRFFSLGRGELHAFEKWCLGGAAFIVLCWFFSNAYYANLLVQVLLTAGYGPTIQKLFRTRTNTEPFSVWLLMGAANTLAIIPARANGDNVLAEIYTWRGAVSVLIILLIMSYFEYRTRKRPFPQTATT